MQMQDLPDQENNQYDAEFGEPLFQWDFKEYEKGHRGRSWYIVAGIISSALLVYALLTQNFTFAFIIILLGIVYFLFEIHEPNDLVIIITDVGVRLGRNFFTYNEIENFWILYFPPNVKNLYLRTGRTMHRTLTIPLGSQNPVEIRETLLNFLQEDLTQEEMPLSESLGKIFKL